jgi:hypothetical protein
MAEQRIVPRFKILVAYDLDTSDTDSYYQFVMGEFVPAVQAMGLYMLEAWHTAYGSYPIRLIGFVSEDAETIWEAFESDTFRRLEAKLLREGFQFIEKDLTNGGR